MRDNFAAVPEVLSALILFDGSKEFVPVACVTRKKWTASHEVGDPFRLDQHCLCVNVTDLN